MDFFKFLPSKEVNLKQFLAFYTRNAPIVENIIKDSINNENRENKNFLPVLKSLSWNEWSKNPIIAVKPLSILVIVLLFDKITYISRLLDHLHDLDELLSHYEIDSDNFLVKDDEIGEIIRKLDILAEKACEIEPLAFILNKDKFPLNKLLLQPLKEKMICSEVLKLINEIRVSKVYNNQLLIPYIIENCIPVSQKQGHGQVFTPLDVTEFICSQNLTKKTSIILDPACGTGILLLGALVFLMQNYDDQFAAELIGIERDTTLASIAMSALCYIKRFYRSKNWNFRILNKDFFLLNFSDLNFDLSNHVNVTVLMNPPYTRQEKLTSEYKDLLNKKVFNEDQNLLNRKNSVKNIISGRSGLYTYFVIRVTNILKTGDKFGLIIPNSWLDVDYGIKIKQFLLDNYFIESIIATRKEKLIPNVDVNTVILKLIKAGNKVDGEFTGHERTVKFISVDRRKDLKKIEKINNFQKLTGNNIKRIDVVQKNLHLIPKWGIFHRATRLYYQLVQNLFNNMIEMGEVSKIRRGFTTGANAFFYVGKPGYENSFFLSSWNENTGDLILSLKDKETKIQFKEQGIQINDPMFVIEKEYWMHKINASDSTYSWEYYYQERDEEIWVPNYVIKSPKDVDKYEINEKNAKYVVLLISHQSKNNVLKSGILSYIEWGENWVPSKGKKFSERPTCHSRKNWFEIPYQEYKDFSFLCLMTINDRFPFFYNPRNFFFDARLYGIKFFDSYYRFFQELYIFLNSILASLQLELLGRSNLGEGGLDIKVYEYRMLKIPDASFFQNKLLKNAEEFFFLLCKNSPISIITGKPEKVKQISEEFISKLFDLPTRYIASLHEEFKQIVESRLEKAGYSPLK